MLPAARGGSCAALIAALALAVPATALGAAGYGPPVQYPAVEDPVPIDAGDLDGDGDHDLVTGNFNSAPQGFSVFVNNGTGAFGLPTSYPSAGNAESLALGRLNADDDPDLASGNNGAAAVLLGATDATFGLTNLFGSWGSAQSRGTAIADFNRDGNRDIVVAQDQRKLVYLRGKGDGTFKPQKKVSLKPKFAGGISVARLNKDKRPDVVIGSSATRGVLVMLAQKGKRPFSKPKAFRGLSYAPGIGTGDLNGDRRADVVEAGKNPSGSAKRGVSGPTFVAVLRGRSGGRLGKTVRTKLPGQSIPGGLEVGDLNGDGKLDVAVARINGTVAILRGTGNGRFKNPQVVDLGTPDDAASVVAARLNADDKLDLAVTNGTDDEITVLLHN